MIKTIIKNIYCFVILIVCIATVYLAWRYGADVVTPLSLMIVAILGAISPIIYKLLQKLLKR